MKFKFNKRHAIALVFVLALLTIPVAAFNIMDSSGVIAKANEQRLISQSVDSYEHARDVAGFAVGKPTFIPNGLALEAVVKMGNGSEGQALVNSLYSDHPITGGRPTREIRMTQRRLAPQDGVVGKEEIDAFKKAGFTELEIQSETAWWKKGVLVQTARDSTPNMDNNQIKLFWNSHNQNVGYVIIAENISFEELIAVVESITLEY